MLQPPDLTVSSEAEFEKTLTVGVFGLALELEDDWELDPRGSK